MCIRKVWLWIAGVPNARMTSQNFTDALKTFHSMTITRHRSTSSADSAPMSTAGCSRMRTMSLLFIVKLERWACLFLFNISLTVLLLLLLYNWHCDNDLCTVPLQHFLCDILDKYDHWLHQCEQFFKSGQIHVNVMFLVIFCVNF